MFPKTADIIDILKEKLYAGDGFRELNKNTTNDTNQYNSFIHFFEIFMKNMAFQYDLCQISAEDDINHFYDEIENNENNLPFFLTSISKILKVRPMKYDLLSKLLLKICSKHDKNDEDFQNLLLRCIKNNYLICELYDERYIPFEKLKNAIRQKDLVFYLFYLKDKLDKQQYKDWYDSLRNSNSIQIQKIVSKTQKLNESEVIKHPTEKYNPNQVAIFIRKDDYDNFLDMVSKFAIPVDSKIPYSIFETNKIFKKLNQPSYVDYSAFYGSTKIFRFLIANQAKISVNTLECACIGGSVEIIRILFQNKISFNQKCFNKAIKYFAEIPVIDFIIQNSENKIGISEMKKAINSFNFTFFTFYLNEELIKSKDSLNNSLLNFAVCKNNFLITQFLCELIKKFLKCDFLIDQKNYHQLTPLIQATSLGNLEIVKLLIKNGANYNEIDDKIFF